MERGAWTGQEMMLSLGSLSFGAGVCISELCLFHGGSLHLPVISSSILGAFPISSWSATGALGGEMWEQDGVYCMCTYVNAYLYMHGICTGDRGCNMHVYMCACMCNAAPTSFLIPGCCWKLFFLKPPTVFWG